MEAIGSGFDGSPLSPYSDRKGESFKTLSQQAVFKLSVSRSRLVSFAVPNDCLAELMYFCGGSETMSQAIPTTTMT